MSAVTFTWANLPANFCWTGPQNYMDVIFGLLQGEVGSDQLIIGDSLPGPDDQDKIWVRLNVDGTLEGIYKFQGEWHRPHPVEPSSSQVIIWKGSEADLWAFDGGDGTDPSGSPPTDFTGAMWERDTDFDFKFPVGIGTNGTTYNGDPATTIAVGGTGGVEKIALAEAELPEHTHTLLADETATSSGSPLATDPVAKKASSTPSGQDFEYDLQKASADPELGISSPVGSGDAHENLPPYRGVIFAVRTARKFIVVT